jgi:hypothetical protein
MIYVPLAHYQKTFLITPALLPEGLLHGPADAAGQGRDVLSKRPEALAGRFEHAVRYLKMYMAYNTTKNGDSELPVQDTPTIDTNALRIGEMPTRLWHVSCGQWERPSTPTPRILDGAMPILVRGRVAGC